MHEVIITIAMNITINEKTVKIFTGAKAVDAIRKYLVEMQKSPADLKSLTIYDKYGHEIDGEAPLKDGDVIEVKAIKEEDTQCEANNPSVSLSIDSIKTPKLESDIVSTPAKIPFPNSKV